MKKFNYLRFEEAILQLDFEHDLYNVQLLELKRYYVTIFSFGKSVFEEYVFQSWAYRGLFPMF